MNISLKLICYNTCIYNIISRQLEVLWQTCFTRLVQFYSVHVSCYDLRTRLDGIYPSIHQDYKKQFIWNKQGIVQSIYTNRQTCSMIDLVTISQKCFRLVLSNSIARLTLDYIIWQCLTFYYSIFRWIVQ